MHLGKLSLATLSLTGLLCLIMAAPAAAQTQLPSDVRVYIIWPKNGQVVTGGKLWLRMGVRRAGIAPAEVKKDNTGHHHVLLDTPLPPLDEEIPSDKNHLHFGGGQTEARLELAPGKHTIQLLFGDHEHMPHDPPLYSEQVTITVP